MNRAVNVARMQLINKWTFLGIPGLILASSTLLTFAIWAVIPDEVGTKYSGAGQAVMWYFLALGIQALTLTFPFSQAMSVSRKSFYAGTLGLFSVVALGVAVLYYVLGRIEQATHGWGMNGQLFALSWVADAPAWVQILFYFVAMVLLFMVGFWVATVYMRWKTTGMLVAGLGSAVLLVGAIALASFNGWWLAIGSWLGAQTPLSTAGWAGLLAVVLAAGSYLTLRRAIA
ncbi:hypothetical protein [Paeniglutamicibacter cryotolerans]|uniref:Uncharacterized protein n=1 Tax=Paeniglutamicibacter cryotolerans TaxID=670079 RepID=A0A839QKN8_9MICC|nr:hypothetical protein [Paeniglutamicibacter cryotolerans]MBB2996417.1 hypothetical protein [Paeniglutamicibacter cryotolerans]